jgi:hypothetical protein
VHHEGAAQKPALSLKIERKRVAMVVERFCGCVFVSPGGPLPISHDRDSISL